MPLVTTGLQVYGATQAGKGGGDEAIGEPKVEENKKNLLFTQKKSSGSLISGVQ